MSDFAPVMLKIAKISISKSTGDAEAMTFQHHSYSP